LVLLIIAEILIFIERNAPNAGNSAMKIRMDRTLRFWADVAYDHIKSEHDKGQIAWKASPAMLQRLADAEREVEDDMEGICDDNDGS
jgi:hypothetical protein